MSARATTLQREIQVFRGAVAARGITVPCGVRLEATVLACGHAWTYYQEKVTGRVLRVPARCQQALWCAACGRRDALARAQRIAGALADARLEGASFVTLTTPELPAEERRRVLTKALVLWRKRLARATGGPAEYVGVFEAGTRTMMQHGHLVVQLRGVGLPELRSWWGAAVHHVWPSSYAWTGLGSESSPDVIAFVKELYGDIGARAWYLAKYLTKGVTGDGRQAALWYRRRRVVATRGLLPKPEPSKYRLLELRWGEELWRQQNKGGDTMSCPQEQGS